MRTFLAVAVVLMVAALTDPVDAATIGWGCEEFGMAMDSQGMFLLDGALIQLLKVVGDIDPYLVRGTGTVNDVLLDEVSLGHDLALPLRPPGTWFEGPIEVNILAGDLLYVRGYNVPKSEVETAPNLEVGIRNAEGAILSYTVAQVEEPQDYFFNNLRTEPIPEPGWLFLLVSGSAAWFVRRRR